MKISFWSIGKSHEAYVREGTEDFTRRIGRYFPVDWSIIPTPRNAGALPEAELRRREGDGLLALLRPDDYLVALDERGRQLSSEGLSSFLQQRATESTRHLVFLIGGAYGLDDRLIRRAGLSWSLSPLTFPHQLVRLLLAEQVYRACTILRNEKYHHR